ncbi:LysE family translocator [Roseibium sp. M-1]
MIQDVNLPLILLAALIATVSPGPATLALAGTSMGAGRKAGLSLASGITTGSLIWSIAAAAGLSAVMAANVWVLEILRYFGAGYLLFLAWKSARSALAAKGVKPKQMQGSYRTLYLKGLALHLTNPKAILFFGSLYSIGVPASASPLQLALVVAVVGVQSFVLFHAYALLFSVPVFNRGYLKLRRWFEAAFSIGFGLAGLKVMTAKLQ